MAQSKSILKTAKGDRVITIFIADTDYDKFENDILFAKSVVAEKYAQSPELFPVAMSDHFKFNGHVAKSEKTGMRLRLLRI